MRARSKLILCAVVISLMLAGCYDAREIDDEIYVISIGVDKGVENKIRLTVQYATYSGQSSGQQGGGNDASGKKTANKQQGSNVHTIECPSILSGIDMLGMAISRRVSLMHAKMVVFSEDFAREGVGAYLAPIQRYRETRGSMAVVVVKGTAEKFLIENQSYIGGTISKAVELIFLQARNNSRFPYVHFHQFYRNMISPYQQAIAIYGGINDFKNMSEGESSEPPLETEKSFEPGELPRRGVAKREFTGIAVFDGDRMVGSLDSEETPYYIMLMGKYKTGAITYKDPEQPDRALILDFRNGRKPDIKAYFKNGKPVIDISLEIEADIESIQSRINYEKPEKLMALNSFAEKNLEKRISEMIRKAQKELKSDIFGFGRYMACNFATIPEWEQYNWFSHFPEADINVDVTVNIRRSGLLINSSPIWSSEGKGKEGKTGR